jgi:hypothetical protein
VPSLVSKETAELAKKIAADENCDIYLYSGPINEAGFGAVVENLFSQYDSAILILSTHGGSANSAYRIARLFQSFYKTFTVFISSYCKSAGTIITLGAHRLIMTDFSELGPLDVQLSKRDEIWERRSGLLLRSALTNLNERADDLFSKIMVSIKSNSRGAVRFRLASELAAELTQSLLSPIYGQITPEGLGEDYQELMVAYEYGKRLASVGRLISETAINRLVHEYPSHDFVIDKLEARDLFSKIEDPTPDMYALASKLGNLVYAPDAKQPTIEPLSKSDEPEQEVAANVKETNNSNEEPKSPALDRTKSRATSA